MQAVECFCSFSPKKLTKLASIKPKSKPVSPIPSPGPSIGSGSERSREEERMREVFRRFDGDGDGKISAEELQSYLGSVGEAVSSEEAEGIIGYMDSDNDRLLGFEDFMRLMMAEEGGGGGEELRAAFGVFEWEGTGRITARSLQGALGRLGDPRSYEECVAMIRAFDSDGEGGIGFDKFRQMMTPVAA